MEVICVMVLSNSDLSMWWPHSTFMFYCRSTSLATYSCLLITAHGNTHVIHKLMKIMCKPTLYMHSFNFDLNHLQIYAVYLQYCRPVIKIEDLILKLCCIDAHFSSSWAFFKAVCQQISFWIHWTEWMYYILHECNAILYWGIWTCSSLDFMGTFESCYSSDVFAFTFL